MKCECNECGTISDARFAFMAMSKCNLCEQYYSPVSMAKGINAGVICICFALLALTIFGPYSWYWLVVPLSLIFIVQWATAKIIGIEKVSEGYAKKHYVTIFSPILIICGVLGVVWVLYVSK